MDWINQSISAFGASLGLPRLSLDNEGTARLRTGSGGAIEIHHLVQEHGNDVLLLWSEPAPYDAAQRVRTALKLADLRLAPGLPLQVAVFDGQLVLASRMDERSVSQPVLEERMDWLRRVHERLQQA